MRRNCDSFDGKFLTALMLNFESIRMRRCVLHQPIRLTAGINKTVPLLVDASRRGT